MNNIKESIVLANEKFDVENWSILGGEPFLYTEKVLEILDFLRKIEPNKVIFFPTNGSLLDKNMDLAVEIIKKYRVWMQVCNHFAAFKDKTKTESLISNVYKLAEKTGIAKAESTSKWWKEIMNYDSGTPDWQKYLKRKNVDIDDTSPNEAAWIDGKSGIYYMEAHSFQSIHYFNSSGKPKPFESSDPEASYWNSCPSCFCALLYDKKIYKCAALGTLKNFLTKHDSLEDPIWQKYLNYKPIFLDSCDDADVKNFSDNHYSHIDECTMCPGTRNEIIKTEEKVLPIYFKKHADR